ncbi:MAG: pyridoxal-phosphate dependent enzyme [Planctomycetota bacterium]
MRIYDNILDTIGRTPLIRLNKIVQSAGVVCVKHEAFNPGGSVKDRIAVHMINEAEKRGDLKPGGTIIECTSGNTGMGIALLASVRGYKAVLAMPDKVAPEKAALLRAFGADVKIAPTAVEPDDPRSYYSVAKRLSQEIQNSFYPNQYQNLDNPAAHYQTTGPEIWDDTDGKITHFVAGCGTGGTITGIAKYLKERNPNVKVIGADPVGSLYYEYFHTGKLGHAHTYKVEGVGEDIIPGTMDFDYVDDVIQIGDRECFATARRLTRLEGIFSGSSAGLAMAVALQVARTLQPNDLMVVLIPDTGERYLSKVYNEDWLRENQLLDSGLDFTAGEILARKSSGVGELVTIDAEAKVVDAIGSMHSQDVSQLPVVRGGQIVGSVREATVLHAMLGGVDAKSRSVSSVMEPPFPVVEASTPADEIFALLSRETPAVMVPDERGQLRIVTKWDLLQLVSGKR